MSAGPPVAGIDACRAGWLVARLAPGGGGRLCCVPDFAAALGACEGAAIVAVDMPIGLPGRAGPGGREAERLLRPHLGARQSSVFSVPSRAAVFAPDYAAACRLALATSDPPRKVARQSYNLFAKMREVDAVLTPADEARVHECHPEGAFWAMNRRRALAEPKKVSGRPYGPGLALRRALLEGAGIAPALLEAPLPRGAGEDDRLDALACAVAARRVAAGEAERFPPGPPPRDGRGLRMVIFA